MLIPVFLSLLMLIGFLQGILTDHFLLSLLCGINLGHIVFLAISDRVNKNTTQNLIIQE